MNIGKAWTVHVERFNEITKTLVSILSPRWPRTRVENYAHQKYVDDYLGLQAKIELKKHGKLFPELRQDCGVNGGMIRVGDNQKGIWLVGLRCTKASIRDGALTIEYTIYENMQPKLRNLTIDLPNDPRWR